MALTHSTVKIAGQKLFAVADWNASHVGTILANQLPVSGDWALTGNLTIDTNVLVVDKGNDKVGIRTTPQYGALEVKPTVNDASTGITLWDGSGSTARSWIGTGNMWHLTRGETASQGITIDNTGKVGI